MQYITFDQGKAYDLILLGRVAIDFNPVDLNRPLEESANFNKYLGGSPANIAVGMARLGKRVGFIGKVSDDQFGDYVTHYFQKEGIDTSHITRCRNGENLGLTFTEIISPQESRILMYRDGVADLMLEPEDVEEAYIRKAKALLISGTALAASPSREAALKAVILARKNGIPVIFDIDYRAYTWKSQDEISVYYSLVAGQSDIILGSREEFDLTERMLGLDGEDSGSARYWQGCGCKIVVIKHGKEGSAAYTCDGIDRRLQRSGSFGIRLRLGFHADFRPQLFRSHAHSGGGGTLYPGGKGKIRGNGGAGQVVEKAVSILD